MIKMFLTLFVVLGSLVSDICCRKYTHFGFMDFEFKDNALFTKENFDNMDGKVFIVKR